MENTFLVNWNGSDSLSVSECTTLGLEPFISLFDLFLSRLALLWSFTSPVRKKSSAILTLARGFLPPSLSKSDPLSGSSSKAPVRSVQTSVRLLVSLLTLFLELVSKLCASLALRWWWWVLAANWGCSSCLPPTFFKLLSPLTTLPLPVPLSLEIPWSGLGFRKVDVPVLSSKSSVIPSPTSSLWDSINFAQSIWDLPVFFRLKTER